MIVIDQHGKTIVITGWRAWLIGAAIFGGRKMIFGRWRE
jgi:hypothetical protein